MPLYDRSYMRPGPPSPANKPNALAWILGITVGFSLVDFLFGSALSEYLALSADNLTRGFGWTFLTYGLVHADILHLLLNGLALFFFGRHLQTRLGDVKLIALHVMGVVAGGLFWLLWNLGSPVPLVGASGGALAILTVFGMLYAEERISLFLIPVSFRAKYLLYFVLGYESLGFLLDEVLQLGVIGFGTAHSAHLGGMAAGAVFHRYLLHRDDLFDRVARPKASVRRRPRPKVAATAGGGRGFRINLTSRNELRQEVDRILDKINSQGFGSLSEEEKRTLDRAKDILSR